MPERIKSINEEVSKFLQAGAIREVEYPEWLANVVLVKKSNGKWRLCIDFTDINKVCLKRQKDKERSPKRRGSLRDRLGQPQPERRRQY